MTIVVLDESSPVGAVTLERVAVGFGRYSARIYRWGRFVGVDHGARCQAQGEPLAGIAAAGLR